MKLIFSFSLLLLSSCLVFGQDIRDTIYSEILKEKRVIQIHVPEGYKPNSKEKYDVVYLLDGKDNIKLFSQVQKFAQDEKYVPPLIIVAIFNTVRNRDLTPTPVRNIKDSGGAEKFLSFLKKELIPYINKAHANHGENILYGHSFGGLFAMYALFREPTLFDSAIMADPSFWYDEQYLNKLAAEKLDTLAGQQKTFYLTGRMGDMKGMGITVMDSILRRKAPCDLFYKITAYDDETHNSVQLKSMYDGLKFLYKGYKTRNDLIEYHPMNGIVLKDKPYTIYSGSSFPDLHYTKDGSIPTRASAKAEEINTFSGPMQLTLKSLTPKGRYDKITTGHFVTGEALRPLSKPANLEPGGVSYAYYEGSWDRIPNFRKSKPIQGGIADPKFTFRKLPSKTNFAVLFDGFIEIKVEGYYIFGFEADDGAKLYLKDTLLIDYDGSHAGSSPQSFLVPLKKGFYPIRLEYFQKDGAADVRLSYVVPGSQDPKEIPHKLLYHLNRF